MKQKLVYQSPRMQSIELSSRAALLSASGGSSTPAHSVGFSAGASLGSMTSTSFQ